VNRSTDEEKLESLLGPADIETPRESHPDGVVPSMNIIKNDSHDQIKITRNGQNDDSST
jgi:hypothetical protein